MIAAENCQWEMCVKLSEIGADLNLADAVSATCCDCMSVCCYIVVTPAFFIELVSKDGLSVGC